MTRQRLPQQGPSSPLYAPFSVRAALAASLSGGLVFALVQVVLLWVVRGAPPWLAARMIAAILLGPTVLSPPDTFDAGVVAVAILLHGMLSIIFGLFLAFLLPAGSTLWTVVVGGLYGLILYYINFYGFNAFSPWFSEQRDAAIIFSHFVFGAVVAGVYKALHPRWYGAGGEPTSAGSQ